MLRARRGTMSSNTPSTPSARAGAPRMAHFPARTTPMPGPRTAMPACRRLPRGSQNAHPPPTPPGRITLNPRGEENLAAIAEPIGPFASRAIDISELLPRIAWPRQIEVRAGKHIVRPRYEMIADGHRRIAHVNVERADLKPNPELPELGRWLGKGYLLPAPILPRGEWQSLALPTPMAVSQAQPAHAPVVYA